MNVLRKCNVETTLSGVVWATKQARMASPTSATAINLTPGVLGLIAEPYADSFYQSMQPRDASHA